MSQSTAQPGRHFASDTYAGICPEAMAAMVEANRGHVTAYGDDPWTARAVKLLRELFETDCEVFFVSTGTAANSLALAAMCQSYHSVLCHTDAHVQTDECGGPEYAARGIKVVSVEGRDGKLDVESIRASAAKRRDVHSHKPGALSLSQSTESGTIYRADEIRALTKSAKELGLRVHMDGARFANALSSLRAAPREITWEAGVDVLCFGGTKNGVSLGDVILFFNKKLAEDFAYRRKQAGHLQAKMRFVSAPWAAMLESGAWRRNAENANAMAKRLEQELRRIDGVTILFPVEANAVFVKMPSSWSEGLRQRGWQFYEIAGGDRLMCSWDTEAEDIAAFVADLRALSN